MFKRRQNGIDSPGTSSVVPGNDTSKGSPDSARNSSSMVSLPPPPPPRRTLVPRQKTADHVSPPPIEEGEIEMFRSQIADLGSCVGNKALFDFLISDIDRNRLTQIALILADRGEYQTMSRVVDLTESLDRLIGSRVEENHILQTRTFSQVLQDADEVLADETVPIDFLRAKVRDFDSQFFAYQNEPFDQVVLLTQKVDEIRKRIREVTIPPSPQGNASLDEPWVPFPTQPGDHQNPHEGSQSRVTDWSASVSVEYGSSPEEVSNLEPIGQARLMLNVFRNWNNAVILSGNKENLAHSIQTKHLLEIFSRWRISVSISNSRRQRTISESLRVLKGWQAQTERMKDVLNHSRVRYFYRILGPSLVAWRSHTTNLANRVFAFVTSNQERRIISFLSEWGTSTKYFRGLHTACESLVIRNGIHRLDLHFFAWQRLRKANGLSVISKSLFRRTCIREWGSHVIKTKQIRNRVDSLKKAYSILAEWRRVKASNRNLDDLDPVYDGDEWEADADFPDNPLDQSSISIPSTVEYYIIHDEPIDSSRPADEQSVIKLQTREIITRAQIFVSQQRFVDQSPARITRRPTTTTHTDSHEQTDFFREFEHKWRREQAKWKL